MATKRNSKYHQDRPCSPCIILCGKTVSYYTHYGGWKETEKTFLREHWKGNLESSSCICVAHQKKANRTHQVCYKPKWSNVLTSGSGIENEEGKLCAYPSCTNSQVIAPSFASLSEIIFFCKFNKNQYHQLFYVQCIIKNCINK